LSITQGWPKAIESRITRLLPQDCFLCAAPAGEVLLCKACIASLPQMPAALCPRCALPAPDSSVCGACMKRAPHFDATHAVFRYEFPLDRMIHALKYAHRLSCAGFLGRMLAQADLRFRPDLIVPVPLSGARLAERGFNQALEIARPLLRILDAPAELTHIHRSRDTTPQASLPWKQRVKNVRHAFECEIDLTGRTVLVVDDVMTTGATLDELARTLKAHGAVHVENLVVARALRD
jgi:ComF family protein